MSTQRQIQYTWDQYDSDIKLLALNVATNFKPDLIIGLMRGGAIPAITLSHLLGVRVEMYNMEDSITYLNGLVKEVNNVLFVDEIVDSGLTLSELRGKVEELPLSKQNWKFACLVWDTSSIRTPDFYVRSIDRNVENYWITFPWEKPTAFSLVLK